MTYTTQERIYELMGEPRLWDTDHDATERRAVAAQIAAQINAMVDRCHATEAATATQTRQVSELRATIDALRAERDAARAQLQEARDGSEFQVATLEGDLAKARAEVERLRPAAEAWLYKQACEAWDAGKITPFEFAEAHKLYSPQARRARAARGTP